MDDETTTLDRRRDPSPSRTAPITQTTRRRRRRRHRHDRWRLERLPTPTQTTPTRTPRSSSALERAVAPVEIERFLAEHWERKPLVVPRGEEGRFDDLLSARDVERLITETGIRTPAFRLVKAGATVCGYTTDLSWRPVAVHGRGRRAPRARGVRAGATIVLQGLHHNWLPLARYCRQLEAFLGHPVQANAYYTPRGSQGLPVHHDTHEVISLQVAGEKRWLVYEPVLELPLKNQRYRSALGAPGEPVLDVTLRAGDTIYLPRGWLHQALTSDSDSLHITVGVNVRRWIDEARAELDEAGERARVPPDDRRRRAAGAAVARRRRRPGARTRRASSQPAADPRRSALRAARARRRSPCDTELERRDTVIADLARDDARLRGPRRSASRTGSPPELEFLVTTECTVPRLRAAGLARRRGPARAASGGSYARGSCDVARRPLELGRRAGEVGRLALLAVHVDVVGRPDRPRPRARQPSPSRSIGRTLHVDDAEQPGLLADAAISAACAAKPWHERPR